MRIFYLRQPKCRRRNWPKANRFVPGLMMSGPCVASAWQANGLTSLLAIQLSSSLANCNLSAVVTTNDKRTISREAALDSSQLANSGGATVHLAEFRHQASCPLSINLYRLAVLAALHELGAIS